MISVAQNLDTLEAYIHSSFFDLTSSHCVALTGLKFSMETRPASSSRDPISGLLSAEMKGMHPARDSFKRLEESRDYTCHNLKAKW